MQIPSQDEVLTYFQTLSNWGRWGPDDVLGTLNHITPAVRLAAARTITEGRTVTCAWDVDTTVGPETTSAPPQRYMVMTREGLADEGRVFPPGITPGDRQAGAAEYVGLVFHGYSVTHLDALSHIFWDGRLYNGQPAAAVSASNGATRHDVRGVADQAIVTRGVLIDVARSRRVPWLEPGEFVLPEELDRACVDQGVEVQPGDAVLLRTGYGRKKLEVGPDHVAEVGRAGWHAACLPWIHGHDVALVGADTAQDVIPSGYDAVRIPLHAVGIPAMGLYLLDNCNLEALSTTCEELGRWSFHLTVAPLRIVGGTGSPVTPVATF